MPVLLLFLIMKKLLLLALIILPLSTWAWDSNSSTEQILQEFTAYVQPKLSGNTLVQWNMKVQYIRNEKNLTDKIVIKVWNVTRIVRWPWSQATPSKRAKALKSIKAGNGYSSAGFYDYSILRLSPSGNYVELVGTGYENWIWRMIDTKTGEIVLSDHVIKGMWSSDRKQFIFETCTPDGITTPQDCTTGLSTYLTTLNQFPKYTKIQ